VKDNDTDCTQTSEQPQSAGAKRRGFFHRAARTVRFHTIVFFRKVRNIFLLELKSNATPNKAALSFSLGIFFGIFPIFGFQTLAAILAAKLMRLNRPLAVLGTIVLLPFMVPIVVAAVWFGSLIHSSAGLATLNPHTLAMLFLENKQEFILENGKYFITGCTIISILAGTLSYFIVYPICKIIKKRGKKHEKCQPAAPS